MGHCFRGGRLGDATRPAKLAGDLLHPSKRPATTPPAQPTPGPYPTAALPDPEHADTDQLPPPWTIPRPWRVAPGRDSPARSSCPVPRAKPPAQSCSGCPYLVGGRPRAVLCGFGPEAKRCATNRAIAAGASFGIAKTELTL